MDLESAEVLTRSGNHLQVLWVQAPPPKVIKGVVISAEQESVATPVTAVIADRNNVRCLYDLWWGIAKAAAPVPIATDDRRPKRCLTALFGIALTLLGFPCLKQDPSSSCGST
jgi:hypothetical protein